VTLWLCGENSHRLRLQRVHVIRVDLQRFDWEHVKLFLLHEGVLNVGLLCCFKNGTVVNVAAPNSVEGGGVDPGVNPLV